MAQTCQNFELIVVNDCSPENLDSVMNLFNDSKIHYYKNEKNFGAKNVVDNWNKCLSYCSGEWVICMGDDDMLMPFCLEEYANAIKKNPYVDEFHGRVRLIDENDDLIEILPDRADVESAYANIIHRLEGRRQYIGDFCYRISRLRKEGGFYKIPFAWGSDDITSYICGVPNGVGNINVPIFCYRMNRLTISNSGYECEKLKALLIVDKWLNDFIANQKPETELERFEFKRLCELREKGLSNAQSFVLVSSFNKSLLNLVKWFWVKKKYGVSFRTYVKSFLRLLFYK